MCIKFSFINNFTESEWNNSHLFLSFTKDFNLNELYLGVPGGNHQNAKYNGHTCHIKLHQAHMVGFGNMSQTVCYKYINNQCMQCIFVGNK